ncbi:MAG: shikimate kinase [Promethearchaeati archaeon]
MRHNSIALIGFMATGKSSVGEKLTESLGDDYRFIETDEIIENMAKKSIPKIFSEDGESRFREYEIEACKQVSQYKKVVISCGGGVVLNKINIDYLKRNCYIVLLEASPDIIYERIIKNGKEKRPIIDKKNVREEIEKVLTFRKSFYEEAADIIIDTSEKTINEIVEEILHKIDVKMKRAEKEKKTRI